AVQRDKGQVGLGRGQLLNQIGADVDRQNVVAQALERVLDAGARLQRHLTLERATALENRDPAQATPAYAAGAGRWRRPRPRAPLAAGAPVACCARLATCAPAPPRGGASPS